MSIIRSVDFVLQPKDHTESDAQSDEHGAAPEPVNPLRPDEYPSSPSGRHHTDPTQDCSRKEPSEVQWKPKHPPSAGELNKKSLQPSPNPKQVIPTPAKPSAANRKMSHPKSSNVLEKKKPIRLSISDKKPSKKAKAPGKGEKKRSSSSEKNRKEKKPVGKRSYSQLQSQPPSKEPTSNSSATKKQSQKRHHRKKKKKKLLGLDLSKLLVQKTVVPDILLTVKDNNGEELRALQEIPCRYRDLRIEDELYYHGLVRNIDTVVMLTQEKSFLVHQTTYCNERYYVLSFRWQKQIHHAIIGQSQSNENLWFIHDYCAPNIVELIDFHCAKKKPVNADGALIKYAVKRRDWSLNVQQLKIGKAIGKGEFGLIYKAQIRRLFAPNRNAVVKVLLDADKMDRFEKARLFCEAQMMMSLRHKNVLRIYGICTDGEDLILALERASNGSLLSYLTKNNTPKRQKLRFCRHLASGMAYLSREGILHRDLAARNCLVSKSGVLKVADFGLSTSGLEAFNLKEKKVPIRWLAPEVLRANTFSGKSDAWSFGIVLYEIWADGKRPYDEVRDKKKVKDMVLGGYRLQPPDGMPDFYASVMAACFVESAKRRASLIQIHDAIRTKDLSLLNVPITDSSGSSAPMNKRSAQGSKRSGKKRTSAEKGSSTKKSAETDRKSSTDK